MGIIKWTKKKCRTLELSTREREREKEKDQKVYLRTKKN